MFFGCDSKLVSLWDFQQSHLCNRRLGQGVKPFVKPFDITRKRFFLEVRSGGKVSILSPRPFTWTPIKIILWNHWFLSPIPKIKILFYWTFWTKSVHLVTLFLKGSYETTPFSIKKIWFKDIFSLSWLCPTRPHFKFWW